MGSENKDLARLILLPQIFENRLFRIPDYQRGYSWGSEQVIALLNDIEQLFFYEHTHYTGTVVLIEKDNPSPLEPEHGTTFNIIDGQQRLTTFSILLARLIENIKNPEEKQKLSKLYLQRGKSGNQTRVFRLNNNVDDYFESCVIQNSPMERDPQYISEKYIINSYTKIKNWVDKKRSEGKHAEDILELITSKFGFLVYSPTQASEAGMMFEVINNRGKSLTELDKVKNYLVYYAIKLKKKNLQEKVNQHWGIILRNLAKAHNLEQPDENALLRATVVCYFGLSKDQCSDIYESVKEMFPLNDSNDRWQELVMFVEFLSKTSAYYECLLNDASEIRHKLSNKKTVEQIERIRSQNAHASIMPLYFAIMSKRDSLGEEKVNHLLKMIEILTFRVYMTRNGAKRTDSGQADLYKLAHALFTNDITLKEKTEKDDDFSFTDVVGVVMKKMYDLIGYYCNDAKLEEGLKLRPSDTDDFYNWGAIRYFLMSYEQSEEPKRTIKIDDILKGRVKGKSNDTPSLEHIWATENVISGNQSHQAKDKRTKRRLGNFALLELGINVQASHSDLGSKVEIYNGNNDSGDKSKFKQIHLLANDYATSFAKRNSTKPKKIPNFFRVVTVETINMNEDRYIKFAKARWSTAWATKYWSKVSNVNTLNSVSSNTRQAPN